MSHAVASILSSWYADTALPTSEPVLAKYIAVCTTSCSYTNLTIGIPLPLRSLGMYSLSIEAWALWDPALFKIGLTRSLTYFGVVEPAGPLDTCMDWWKLPLGNFYHGRQSLRHLYWLTSHYGSYGTFVLIEDHSDTFGHLHGHSQLPFQSFVL